MQTLIHWVSASKSLFLHYEGAGVLFPVTGKPGKKNIIVTRRGKETWFTDYIDVLMWKEKVIHTQSFNFSFEASFRREPSSPWLLSVTFCSPALPWIPTYLLTSSWCARNLWHSAPFLPLCILSPLHKDWQGESSPVNSSIFDSTMRSPVWDLEGGKEAYVWAAVCRCVGFKTSKVWL